MLKSLAVGWRRFVADPGHTTVVVGGLSVAVAACFLVMQVVFNEVLPDPDIPDVDRITVCMIKNRSQLSPGCRAFFRPDPEAAVSVKSESSRRQASDRPRRSRRDDD